MSYATPNTIDNAIGGWTDAVLHCRSWTHSWRNHAVTHTPGLYEVTQRCNVCGTTRRMTMNDYGRVVVPWKHSYTSGYLLRGVGSVSPDGRAQIRLGALRNTVVREVPV